MLTNNDCFVVVVPTFIYFLRNYCVEFFFEYRNGSCYAYLTHTNLYKAFYTHKMKAISYFFSRVNVDENHGLAANKSTYGTDNLKIYKCFMYLIQTPFDV